MKNENDLATMCSDLNRRLQEKNYEMLGRLYADIASNGNPGRNENEQLLEAVKKNSEIARQNHLLFSDWLKEYIEKAKDLDDTERKRVAFWTKQIVSLTAPSNFFWTNPGAVRRYIKSKGESVGKGLQNIIDDIKKREGLISLVDESAFTPGENIAATPGSVVYRNDLMELIQYHPTAKTTHPLPVVFIQPWINKYYIFDLSPQNSFVRYMLDEGFNVFITSWKNPTEKMRNTTFEDYMIQGAREAVEVAGQICKTKQVHAAGYCIGGAVLTALMAWLNNKKSSKTSIPVADWTLFATLVDYSEPGEIGNFIGENQMEAMERIVQADGFLDKKYLSLAFRLLNPDGLIWRYHANNYLYGQNPPRSDMLFWNSDGTRLPAEMFRFYVKEFYMENRLARKNGLTLANRPIDTRRIKQPLYMAAAIQDHISPWKSSFKTVELVKCPVKFVLSGEGHITGIVNPPSHGSRKKLWMEENVRETDPDSWLKSRTEQTGSWWPDWVKWLKEKKPEETKPAPVGSRRYPPLENAPGTYVFEK